MFFLCRSLAQRARSLRPLICSPSTSSGTMPAHSRMCPKRTLSLFSLGFNNGIFWHYSLRIVFAFYSRHTMFFLKHLYIKIAKPFYLTYWFIFRPKTKGVKVLIECNDSFLFIKNTYHPGRISNWTLPGGGIDKDELPLDAARREVREEVGIELNNLKFLGTFFTTQFYKRDTVYCFHARVRNVHYILDPVEVAEARWFSKDALPEPLAPNVRKALDLYRANS